MEKIDIINTTPDNILNYGVCGYKNIKRKGYPEKINWVKDNYPKGLRIKTLYSEKDGTQGMIEYIPGEYCWRPVDAKNYLFIHCVFVGFKNEYKNKGYATLLINQCFDEAKKQKMHGLVVVTRKGSFMVGKEIFIKNGFEIVDNADPDFELLVKRVSKDAPLPKFKDSIKEIDKKYENGLFILRADQCPYSVKNVEAIIETSKKKYKIVPNLIEFKNSEQAQDSPCAFGTFCIMYNKEVIAYHPISNTRFINIMEKKNNKK